MTSRNILIIGGSGFVGSAITTKLSAQGCRVLVPTRRRERAKHLITLPTVDVIEADVRDENTLAGLMPGVDAVINLVGILHSDTGTPWGKRFQTAHVDLARKVADACATAGVPRLLHMSSLGAASNAPSMYLRSKAAGEAAVMSAVRNAAKTIAVTMFRSSVVFGRGDKFINLFAWMQRYAPVVALGKPDAKLQCVWVEDVAQAFVNALDAPHTFGKTYELAGPKVYTLKQLVEYAGQVSDNPRMVFGLPDRLAYLQALLMEFAPVEILSRDNLDSTKVDSVISAAAMQMMTAELGITPAAMEAVVPAYLSGQSPKERYMQLRDHAGR
jgi:uncharacterized protein YbjT (DUF2867 family)